MKTRKVDVVLQKIVTKLGESSDVATFSLGQNGKYGVVYLKSMIDDKIFFESICKNLREDIGQETLSNKIVGSQDLSDCSIDALVDKVLNGFVIIISTEEVVGVDILLYPARIPSEPPTSQVIQGPREGFVEDIRTNLTLLRRRFYSQSLVIKNMCVGKQSKTKVSIAYLKDIANANIVKEVKKKIANIEIDGVVDSYYILKKLEDFPHSLFKQVGSQEKPDIVAAKLLEGRVAIIVDGSPIVLTVPYMLMEDFQNSNDYYTNNIYATLIRFVRLIGVFVAIIVPGTYLAFRLYHFNVIPVTYLITIANTTMALPFTPFIELFFISLLFQVLYEVSLRLPSYLGLATSIVGALILGDTGVKAGLISPPGVIIIALSKIAVYTVPEQASQLTVLQFVFLLLGGSVGILGIIGGVIYIVNYLNTIDSFGVPYLSPYSPKITEDLKDGFFKAGLSEMKKRPLSLNNKNITRQK